MAETTEQDRETDASVDSNGSDEAGETEPQQTLGARSPDEKLLRALTDFKEDVQERVRDLLRAKKAAEQLCRDGALENLELVQKYADWLRDADLEPIEMEERREKAVDSLDAFVKRRRNKRRMSFMRQLHDRADDRGLEVEKLSESPPAMYVEPFVVAPDFETGRVELSYARETIAETDLDPDVVFERRDHWAERFAQGTPSPEAFFDRLELAYELARNSRERGPGERVELVDLLAPLALLRSDPEDWRDPELEAVDGYPKYLLAYQLQGMRREGLLERDGTRVDLGTATGGSTRDKDDVVFIPSGPDDGQYYLSIRLVDEETDG